MYRPILLDSRTACAGYGLPSARYRKQPVPVCNKRRVTHAISDRIRSGTFHRNGSVGPRAVCFCQSRQVPHHIGLGQQLRQVVYKADEGDVIHFSTGNLLEEVGQERVCVGDLARGILTAEGFGTGMVVARRKQTVGERLRKHIGELCHVQIGDKYLLERVVKVMQGTWYLVLFKRETVMSRIM